MSLHAIPDLFVVDRWDHKKKRWQHFLTQWDDLARRYKVLYEIDRYGTNLDAEEKREVGE